LKNGNAGLGEYPFRQTSFDIHIFTLKKLMLEYNLLANGLLYFHIQQLLFMHYYCSIHPILPLLILGSVDQQCSYTALQQMSMNLAKNKVIPHEE